MQSCKFGIYPAEDQKILIAKSFGCARWIFPGLCGLCGTVMRADSLLPDFNDLRAMLKGLKKAEDTKWLAEPDKYALANAMKDLKKAYENHFSNPSHFGWPTLKSKQSYRTNYFISKQSGFENIEIDEEGGRIKLPRCCGR